MRISLFVALAMTSLGLMASPELRERIYYQAVSALYEREHPTARLIIALYAGDVSPRREEDVLTLLNAGPRFIPEPDLERIMSSSGGLTDWVFMRDIRNREMGDRIQYPEIYTYTRLVDYHYRQLHENANTRHGQSTESMEDIVNFWSEHAAGGEWDYRHQTKNRLSNSIHHDAIADLERHRIRSRVMTESFRRFGGDSEVREHWEKEELERRYREIEHRYSAQETVEPELNRMTDAMKAWIGAMWDLESNLIVMNAYDYKRCDRRYACMAFLKLPLPPLVLN
ncbi:hypothetical protein [Marinobacter sp. P4B1]|uniref:hypothetical protein n=1 Tax=Marinobacter sp. P4B1 TaxID=1119533 RepID=UPI0011A2B65B|nr:hypothetical protein [Marinobacter sp. P4B1]